MIQLEINIRDNDITDTNSKLTYAELKQEFNSKQTLSADKLCILFNLIDFLINRLAHSESDRFNRR